MLANIRRHSFAGWDFSYLTETGRMGSGPLSWSYGSMALPLVREAKTLLDMGTGGGELLSKLAPFPERTFATECYPPNVPIARKRLEPLGAVVVPVENDDALPFEDGRFDLILNRHESYSAREVRRIVAEDGLFLTQQSGGLDCREINAALGVPLNPEFQPWDSDTAAAELEANGFEILMRKEEFPVQRFFDIECLLSYLSAIPWQVPGFAPEAYAESLYDIHRSMERKGFFDATQHRFILKARPV
ncbi:methyltransferase domain-containing protein [Paenibacillus sp. GYB003]